MNSVSGIWIASRPSERKRSRYGYRPTLAVALFLLCIGCGREPALLELPTVPPTHLRAPTFSVMSFHLGDRYAASSSARPDELLPEPTLRMLAQAAPDVLALYGVSDEATFAAFRSQLADAGAPYPHVALLEGEEQGRAIALLSRHPAVLRQKHDDDTYRIGNAERSIEPGILDITYIIDGRSLVRVYVADLVDKTFHPLGQAEMRRNEARLLAQRINRALRDQPDLPILLACALSDIRDSAPFRELTERRSDLIALDPRDSAGNAWTWQDPDGGAYHTHDFFFVSAALKARLVPEQTAVLDVPELLGLSPHRPILATFRFATDEP